MKEMSTREKLILKGMDEIREHGVQGFSLRRVASQCGVSCAAPYKHFADKQDMFLAMIDHINETWDERVKSSFKLYDTVEETIAVYAMDYVTFLCENPQFKAVLMINDAGLDAPVSAHAAGISVPLGRLFIMLKRKRGMTREQIREQIFLVRALMYGSAVIMETDDTDYEQKLALLKEAVYTTMMKN